MLCLDEHVLDEKIVTARAAQSRRVPCVENLALRQFHEALPSFRHPVVIYERRPICLDNTAQPNPLRMLAAAGEREPSADTVAAGRPLRSSGRRGSRCGADLEVGIHGPGNLLIQKSGHVSAVAVDHGAPADRPISHGECLDHAKLRKRVEFRAAPSMRHRHTENSGVLQSFHDWHRYATQLLDRFRRCTDFGSQGDRGVQNGRVSRLRVACGTCHD